MLVKIHELLCSHLHDLLLVVLMMPSASTTLEGCCCYDSLYSSCQWPLQLMLLPIIYNRYSMIYQAKIPWYLIRKTRVPYVVMGSSIRKVPRLVKCALPEQYVCDALFWFRLRYLFSGLGLFLSSNQKTLRWSREDGWLHKLFQV